MVDDMLVCTVSTVYETTENLDWFVRGNLAMGVDHMVVFVDDPAGEGQARSLAYLQAQPHVTAIPTDQGWWRTRPQRINLRQRIHANLAQHALATVPDLAGVAWLFHIDADEVLVPDRDALAALPDEVLAVRCLPYESVAQLDRSGPPTRFKRPATEAELLLMHDLGLIRRPAQRAYLRGHVAGKTGVRPGRGLRLAIHDARSADDSRAEAATLPGFMLLHDHARSSADFVTKVTRLGQGGNAPVQRGDKRRVHRRFAELAQQDLPEPVRAESARQLFEEWVADPVEDLDRLGMLLHLDPLSGTHRPRGLSAPQQAALREGLEAFRGRGKRHFATGDAPASTAR